MDDMRTAFQAVVDVQLDMLMNRPAELIKWAEGKRVAGHLTDGRVDLSKCRCKKNNCLKAQATADMLRHLVNGYE